MTTSVDYKFIWGASLVEDGLGEESFSRFLGDALEQGKYVCSPAPMVVGQGLENLQHAMDVLAKGVSAKKIVVTM